MNVRLSTARTIIVGPVLDADGVAKTDEVVASVKIHKNGGAAAALNGSATLTHSQTGYYLLALTTSDLDTLGCAEFTLNSGTNSMPPVRLNVLTADAWDALHHASDGKVRANVTHLLGTAWLPPAVAGTPDVNANKIAGSATAATNLKQSALALATGTVATDGSNTATTFKIDSTLGAKAANYFGNDDGGLVLAFVAGTANEWQSRRVVAFNATTDFITVEEPFNGTPTDADAFVLLGRITGLN